MNYLKVVTVTVLVVIIAGYGIAGSAQYSAVQSTSSISTSAVSSGADVSGGCVADMSVDVEKSAGLITKTGTFSDDWPCDRVQDRWKNGIGSAFTLESVDSSNGYTTYVFTKQIPTGGDDGSDDNDGTDDDGDDTDDGSNDEDGTDGDDGTGDDSDDHDDNSGDDSDGDSGADDGTGDDGSDEEDSDDGDTGDDETGDGDNGDSGSDDGSDDGTGDEADDGTADDADDESDGDRPDMRVIETDRSGLSVTKRIRHMIRGQVTLPIGLELDRLSLVELSFASQFRSPDTRVTVSLSDTTVEEVSLPDDRGVQELGYITVDYTSHASDPGPQDLAFLVDADLPAGADAEHVQLYGYDDGWEPLPTQHVGDSLFLGEADRVGHYAVGYGGAAITLSDLSVTQPDGDTAQVSLTARNDGHATGERTIDITADGETVKSPTVALPERAERTETFDLQLAPGTYSIAVDGDAAGEVTIRERGTAGTPDDTVPGTGSERETMGGGIVGSDPVDHVPEDTDRYDVTGMVPSSTSLLATFLFFLSIVAIIVALRRRNEYTVLGERHAGAGTPSTQSTSLRSGSVPQAGTRQRTCQMGQYPRSQHWRYTG